MRFGSAAPHQFVANDDVGFGRLFTGHVFAAYADQGTFHQPVPIRKRDRKCCKDAPKAE